VQRTTLTTSTRRDLDAHIPALHHSFASCKGQQRLVVHARWEKHGQIRIPLTAEAISQIREVDGDGYSYELTLDGVEATNKTPRKEKK